MKETDKTTLRKIYKNKRNELDYLYRHEASLKIFDILQNLDIFNSCSKLLIFLDYNSEVITHEFIKDILESGNKEVYVPLTDNKDMHFVRIYSMNTLVKGYMGIEEPSNYSMTDIFKGEESMSEKECICIVPGLVFDKEGNRIGYGGGYYDRFLRNNPKVVSIGVAYECQCLEALPSKLDYYDIKMDYVLNDKGLYKNS